MCITAFGFHELLWFGELRIANCKWGLSRPTLIVRTRAAFVYLDVVHSHRSTFFFPKAAVGEAMRASVSQLKSTLSTGIDTVAFGRSYDTNP